MRRICWDQNLVRQLFTTEADTKLTRDSFLQLHQPFNRIRIVAAKPYVFGAQDLIRDGQEQFVGEEGLLQAFRTSRLHDPNRIFVLTGEPGAGKSHLARWLSHMLEESPAHFPIHLPRRINTLVGVLQRLCDVAGLQLEQQPSSYLVEAPPHKVVRYLVAYLDMAVGLGTPASQRTPLLARVVARPEMEALLSHQVARYQAARKVGTADGVELIMVPEEEFGRLAPGGTLPERTEAYAALRHHLTEALRKLTNLDNFDLKSEMARISSALVAQGRRPVLILEDITSFDLLHDDLLTFLLDEAAGNVDALVCWTTGYEKAYLRTYQLDRYTARLCLSDGNKEVYALQDGGFVNLVKGYLDAVKPWCKPGVCDLYERCIPAFQGLYPFNPESLGRIYENLIGSDQERRKTPRNLLDRAVKSYLELAEGHGAFPPLQQPPVVRDVLYPELLFQLRHSHPSFVALATWYGKEQGDALTLDAEVLNLLGITVPDVYQSREQVVVPLRRDNIQDAFIMREDPAARSDRLAPDAEKAHQGLEIGLTVNVTGAGSHLPPDKAFALAPAAEKLAVTNRLKELLLEIQAWTTSLKVPPHSQDLARGIHKLLSLFKLRMPVALGHPQGHLAGVIYGKAQGESNLTLAGTRGKVTPVEQFMLNPADVVALGRETEIWQAALALQVTGELPSQADLAFLSHWCHARHVDYQAAVENRLTAALGMPLAEWVLAARWTLLAARTGATEPTYGQLLGTEPLEALPSDLVTLPVFGSELDKALDLLQSVLDGIFSVAKGIYDAPRVSQALNGLHPDRFLMALASTAHTKVDPDYHVGTIYPLRDLVQLVKQVAAAAVKTDVTVLCMHAQAELRDVAAGLPIDVSAADSQMTDLRRLIGLSERYELFDPQLYKDWEDGRTALPTAQRYLPAAMAALKRSPTSFWAYLPLARQVAQLRVDLGCRAAQAVARTGARLQTKLDLPPADAPLLQLQSGVQCLRGQLRTVNQSLIDALQVLEAEVQRRGSRAARQALRTLRWTLQASG